MSEKPVIFISHATRDKDVALQIQDHILDSIKLANKIWETKVEVFVSSSPTAIDIGQNWLSKILEKLDATKILIILVTDLSLQSKWVWFELGYMWNKQKVDENIKIYPLAVTGVEIPSSLNILQAKFIDDQEQYTQFNAHIYSDICFIGIDQLSQKIK